MINSRYHLLCNSWPFNENWNIYFRDIGRKIGRYCHILNSFDNLINNHHFDWLLFLCIQIAIYFLLTSVAGSTSSIKRDTQTRQWRRKASEFGWAFGGQTRILGGQDRIFKNVLLFAHAIVTGLLSPPGDSPPLKRGRYS
jgi:hypothetical protein